MIKNIVFDVSGVITEEGAKTSAERIAGLTNTSFAEIWAVVFHDLYYKAYVGSISSKEYYEKSKKIFNKKISRKKFAGAYLSGYAVRKEVLKIIKKLCKKYALYVLSNQTLINSKFLHPVLDKYFQKIVFSDEVKKAKPDIKIYKLLLKNIKPSQSIYIDDKEKHLAPAKKLGFHTILFKDIKQFKNELASFSIFI